MAWFYILSAAACEMVWPLGFKFTNGFKSNHPAIAATFAIMILSFWLMSQSVAKGLHVGTAYAIWTGIGTAGTAILAMIFFKEPRDAIRIACLVLIIASSIGLKFLSLPPHHHCNWSKPTEPRMQIRVLQATDNRTSVSFVEPKLGIEK